MTRENLFPENFTSSTDGSGGDDAPDLSTSRTDDALATASEVPEKFIDANTGNVRVDALARSYRELERRMSLGQEIDDGLPDADKALAEAAEGDFDSDLDSNFDDNLDHDLDADDGFEDDFYPDAPGKYQIAPAHPWIDGDEEINNLLHAAGFTQGQAQLVYDLAAEKVVPLIEGIISQTGVQQQQARLAQHFGGGADFEKTAEQVAAWGKANLPPHLFQSLSASPDGVITMRHLMRSGEPTFLTAGGDDQAADEGSLHDLMDDPKYWRDHDPDTVRRVQEGFRKLYPE